MVKFARLSIFQLLSWSTYPLVFVLIFAVSQISRPSLAVGSLLRAYDMIVLMLFSINTTPYTKFFELLSRVSVTLSNLGLLTYRFFFLLAEKLQTSLRIIEVRGGATGIRRFRILSYLIGTLLVNAMDSAERVYGIMVTRGYQGRIRTISGIRGIGRADVPILIAVGFFLAGGMMRW